MMMMMRTFFLLALTALSSFCAAQDALRDIQMGMEGLKQMANDPQLLAQLMRDMQDPKMMEEAQKMMKDPKYQAEMKKMSNSKEFKESIKKTQEMFEDPHKAAAAEAKVEHMMKLGNDQMKKASAATVDATMEAMMKDPSTMAEMAKMVKDPKFKQQFDEMMNDPSFRDYIGAMQDMMKDPSKKQKFDQAAAGLKAAM